MKCRLIIIFILLLCLCFYGCRSTTQEAQIAATTLPVYEFTTLLCQGTGITVTRLINEEVSCLHDYTLQVSQMQALEVADWVVISGAGLEDFLEDVLPTDDRIIDASTNIPLICSGEDTDHEHHDNHGHAHNQDPHIWLSPANAKTMSQNICQGLLSAYPEYTEQFTKNLETLIKSLDDLDSYASTELNNLSCREIITFHDGFAYMAEAFDLNIIHSIEEESGSEASAAELMALTMLVDKHQLGAVFIEKNGSSSAASIIASETGAFVYRLDTAMSGESYFEAMYHNIDTLKEALE